MSVSFSKDKDSLIQLVRANVKDIVTNNLYMQLLNMMEKFYNYTATNVILIMLQRPDSSFLLDKYSWHSLGREVKREELNNSIKILLPFSKVQNNGINQNIKTISLEAKEVYDISQTIGEHLSIPTHKLDPLCDFDTIIQTIIKISPHPLDLEFISCFDDTDKLDILKRAIILLSTTMIHYTNYDLKDRETVSIEIESLAFIVCKYLGLVYNPMLDNVTKWSNSRKISYIIETLENIQRQASNVIFKLDSFSSD